jgi:hypothetical protein
METKSQDMDLAEKYIVIIILFQCWLNADGQLVNTRTTLFPPEEAWKTESEELWKGFFESFYRFLILWLLLSLP